MLSAKSRRGRGTVIILADDVMGTRVVALAVVRQEAGPQ
jgi:hypothetical protein